MEGITLVEALARMAAAQEPFTLRFVRLDKGRKTGGQITEWARCRLVRPSVARGARPTPNPSPAGEGGGEEASRMPRHFANATRNIVQGNSTQRRKVHIWLLLALNGQRIVLG